MTIYIALLRGINVGGKNIIKMADLKKAFESIGFSNVKTYIQSGNVLFKSDEDEDTIREKIEQGIELTFGFSVAVVLRSADELEEITYNCPFTIERITEAKVSSEGESLYVALLSHEPCDEDIKLLNSYKSESDEYEIKGREIFLLFHNSIRNSKLANSLQKIKVPATVRNWNTINKLAALSKTIEM